MILLRYAITLFNVYFYYYSFYLVILSFVCNTIYVSGNTNKQSLLSMLTAIKHFLSSSEYYCVPPRGGAGGGHISLSLNFKIHCFMFWGETHAPFHILVLFYSCLCPCCSHFNLSLCHLSPCRMSLLQNHVAGLKSYPNSASLISQLLTDTSFCPDFSFFWTEKR